MQPCKGGATLKKSFSAHLVAVYGCAISCDDLTAVTASHDGDLKVASPAVLLASAVVQH